MNLENFANTFVDYVFPSSGEKKWSSSVNFYKFLVQHKEVNLLEDVFNGCCTQNSNLDDEIKNLKKYRIKNFKKFNNLLMLLCDCFFTNIEVKKKLNLQLEQPFPNGNNFTCIDFTILGDVYNRGKKYREVD